MATRWLAAQYRRSAPFSTALTRWRGQRIGRGEHALCQPRAADGTRHVGARAAGWRRKALPSATAIYFEQKRQ